MCGFAHTRRRVQFGKANKYIASPRFMFKFCYLEWVPRLSLDDCRLFFPAMLALALCVALGLFYRASTVLFAAGFFVLCFQDLGLYLNHFYLILVVSTMLCFVPANESRLALDAHCGLARRSSTVPRWTVWLLRAFVSIVYVHAGVAKINGDWLRCEPLLHWVPSSRLVSATRVARSDHARSRRCCSCRRCAGSALSGCSRRQSWPAPCRGRACCSTRSCRSSWRTKQRAFRRSQRRSSFTSRTN